MRGRKRGVNSRKIQKIQHLLQLLTGHSTPLTKRTNSFDLGRVEQLFTIALIILVIVLSMVNVIQTEVMITDHLAVTVDHHVFYSCSCSCSLQTYNSIEYGA
jgi:hypothetical protein